MKKLLLVIVISALAYKGYCNFQSYPKRHINISTIEEEELEMNIFFGESCWNPPGRDKPVYQYNDKLGHPIGKWDTISSVAERTC